MHPKVITTAVLLLLTVGIKADGYCGKYNCYELLGVDGQADEQTIKKAYRQMAKRYHPDKNKQDTTQFFQMINKAYEILTDSKARFKYNLHLRNPTESDYYHEYQYYKHTYIQDPQIPPSIVIIGFLSLASLLQFIMRKQMYERAVWSISEGHDFKAKVNERCGKDKRMKERVREEMIEEISVEGGYSKPQIKDILICKIVLLPYILYKWGKEKLSWFYRYTIKKLPYSQKDKQFLTIKALGLTLPRWQTVPLPDQAMLLGKELWISVNMQNYKQQQKREYLEQLKSDNPRKYTMVMKHLKKNQ